MTRVGAFTPEQRAKTLAAVELLNRSGFALQAGQKKPLQEWREPPIFCQNVSGEEIPAYACVQATGTVEAGGINYLEVDKPADAVGDAGPYFFNGPSAIEIDGYGMIFDGPLVRALGDGTSATAGDAWGPAASSWEVAPASNGLFIAVGNDDVATDVVRLMVQQNFPSAAIAYTGVSGVPARSGTTAGSATVTLYKLVGATLTSTSVTVTAYNLSTTAVAGSAYIQVKREYLTGKWLVDFEDCP